MFVSKDVRFSHETSGNFCSSAGRCRARCSRRQIDAIEGEGVSRPLRWGDLRGVAVGIITEANVVAVWPYLIEQLCVPYCYKLII